MADNTKYIKGGESPDPLTGSLTTPIYQTVAYRHPVGDVYRYSRERNPTVEVLARKVAEIEGAESASVFSSGMAAITTTLLALLKPGDTLVLQRDVFGRTLRFAREFLSTWGVRLVVPGVGNKDLVDAVRKGCTLVFVESVTNPALRVTDIGGLSQEAHRVGAKLVVDNTLPTPVNIKPLEWGADLVVHSGSKFLAGHYDVVCGVVAGGKALVERVDELRKTLGCSLDPHAAYLTIRGIKTLKVRMERINQSALKVAEYLAEHPKVAYVRYPGLPQDPENQLAKRVLWGFGGVVSFCLKSESRDSPEKLMANLKLIQPANTFGAVDSVISHPATMSHRNLTEEERVSVGVPWGLLRLSVGLEDVGDIIGDLEQALSKV
ncbi:MAG: PLP-dependent transferase [Thermoprotei archaeon]